MTDGGPVRRVTRGLRGATPTLSARWYRHVDRASKLLGVALVAAGLDAGGATVEGVLLGVVGTAVAVSTVFIRREP
ncbi:hypothetical protein [Salinigranum sp. GCM10025319]|uniref:hypothetical protein n=1 Tax=Salinigranum sp. GCM10025319 TaxID=3252687 RepID=UPI003621F534